MLFCYCISSTPWWNYSFMTSHFFEWNINLIPTNKMSIGSNNFSKLVKQYLMFIDSYENRFTLSTFGLATINPRYFLQARVIVEILQHFILSRSLRYFNILYIFVLICCHYSLINNIKHSTIYFFIWRRFSLFRNKLISFLL